MMVYTGPLEALPELPDMAPIRYVAFSLQKYSALEHFVVPLVFEGSETEMRKAVAAAYLHRYAVLQVGGLIPRRDVPNVYRFRDSLNVGLCVRRTHIQIVAAVSMLASRCLEADCYRRFQLHSEKRTRPLPPGGSWFQSLWFTFSWVSLTIALVTLATTSGQDFIAISRLSSCMNQETRLRAKR